MSRGSEGRASLVARAPEHHIPPREPAVGLIGGCRRLTRTDSVWRGRGRVRLWHMQRPLLLTGYGGVGKSSLGRIIARRVGVPLLDLTARTECGNRSDSTSATTYTQDPATVAGQQERLKQVLALGQPQVVALGADTLLDREVRLRAVDEAVVVALEASAAELARRSIGQIGGSATTAQAESQIGRVLELRREAVAEAHARVSTEAAEVDKVAERVLAVWRRDALAVAAGSRSYTVETGQAIAAARLPEIVAGSPRTLLVTDSNVAPLYADRIQAAIGGASTGVSRVVLAAGEEHKNVASLQRIWEAALSAGADRGSLVVGLGGGSSPTSRGWRRQPGCGGCGGRLCPPPYWPWSTLRWAGRRQLTC